MIRKRAELYVLRNGKVYVGSRGKKLEIPGGGVLKGERPIDGARRETLEEIGIRAKNIKKLTNKPVGWKFPPGEKYSGQIVYSFRGDFDGVDKEKWGGGPEGKYHPTTIKIDDLIKYFEKKYNKAYKDEDKSWLEHTIKMIKLLK